jgi:hypothetical protein
MAPVVHGTVVCLAALIVPCTHACVDASQCPLMIEVAIRMYSCKHAQLVCAQLYGMVVICLSQECVPSGPRNGLSKQLVQSPLSKPWSMMRLTRKVSCSNLSQCS